MAESLSVLRLSSDGSLDAEYADGGQFVFQDPGVNLLAVHGELDTDGRAVFSGIDIGTDEGMLGRLLPNGSLDDSFGLQGVIGIGGHITLTGDRVLVTNDETITMLGPDGVPDPTFGSGGSVDIGGMGMWWAARVREDAKIVLFGGEVEFGDRGVLIRLDASGDLDPSFGSDGLVGVDLSPDPYGTGIALDAEGRILVSGQVHEDNNYVDVLRRFTADGQIDASFGEGGALVGDYQHGYRGQVEVLPDGRILVIGNGLTRLLPHGELDLTFGEQGGLHDFGDGIASTGGVVAQDGRIYFPMLRPDSGDEYIERTTLFCIKPNGHD